MTNKEAVENNYVAIFEASDVNNLAWEIIIKVLRENIPGFNVGFGDGNYMEFTIPKNWEENTMTVYLVWFGNDEMEDVLVGIADTREKAEEMKMKLESEFDDAYECRIQPFVKNQVTINDVQYRY